VAGSASTVHLLDLGQREHLVGQPDRPVDRACIAGSASRASLAGMHSADCTCVFSTASGCAQLVRGIAHELALVAEQRAIAASTGSPRRAEVSSRSAGPGLRPATGRGRSRDSQLRAQRLDRPQRVGDDEPGDRHDDA
jgi:hypothetical protein